MGRRKFYYRFRDAGTGKFVSREYAEANPSTTLRERVKVGIRAAEAA